MKKFLKMLGLLVVVGLLAVGGFVGFAAVRGIPTYDVPPAPAVQVVATPARLAQGEKLVMLDCADCHLNRRTNSLAGQRLTDTPPEFGALYSSNITQDKEHGIGAWSDADIVTLLRTGIGRDGRYRLLMPQFAKMSDEDVASIVAFLRSDNALVRPDPTPSHAPEPSLLAKVLTNSVMKPLPLPVGPQVAPAPTEALAYGRYLVTGRYVCFECHSKDFKTNNALEPEKSEGYLGGGNKLLNRQGHPVYSRNITADPETGLGDWTAAQFRQALRFGMSPNGPLAYPMPKYSTLTDAEADAIFAYLQTVPKIKNITAEDAGAGAIAGQ